MAKREPAQAAEAQKLISDNLELDADTFDEPGDDDETPEGSEGEQDEGDIEGPDGDGEAIREPGPDELDDMRLQDGSEVVEQPDATQQPQPQREARFDKKGNVVDAKTGRVIAPAGPAARFYQEAFRARQESVTYRAQVADVNNRLERAIAIGTQVMAERDRFRTAAENPVAKQLGLSETEVLDGLQLVKQAKTDPKGALQKLLTRAAANGIDISSLGIQGTEGLAPYLNAMREEMTKLTQPITEQQKQAREAAAAESQKQEVFARTEAGVRRYFEERPDQIPYLPIYNAVMTNPRFSHMSLGEVGARIEMNLLRQRFEAGRRPANPNATRSRPNGRAPIGPGARREEVLAPVSMSYDEILKPIVRQYYK